METKYYLGFNLFSDFGPIAFGQILHYFKSAKTAWRAPKTSWQNLGFSQKKLNNFFAFRKTINLEKDIIVDRNFLIKLPGFKSNDKIKIITWQDKTYPKRLKNIYAAPPLLYCLGNLELLTKPAVAIVGSRRLTCYGRKVTEKLTCDIVRQFNLVIISGLAQGADSVAHKTCLNLGGNTIAVLGSGINVIYPNANKDLYWQIIKNKGLIISEFPPNTTPRPGNFPQRNRVVAGLSLAVVVTQAAAKSGSLITARLAAEAGIDVMAVPGPIDNHYFAGANWLIKQGANLITSADDLTPILENAQFN